MAANCSLSTCSPSPMLILNPRVTAVMMAATASGECLTMRAGQFARRWQQRLVRHDHVDQADLQRPRRCEGIAGQQKFQRPLASGEPRQPLRAAEGRRHAENDFRLGETRGLAGDGEWTASVISQPPPKASPLTAAMTGFLNASRRAVIACPRRTKSRTAASRPAATLSENSWMSAPAEKARSPAPVRMTARASDRSRSRRAPQQAVEQRVVQRIELVGTVEREQRDGASVSSRTGSDIVELPKG